MQVLDRNTRIILFKLLNKGVVGQINGCVSTGKEANVYHATAADGTDRAIKVYKTSILVFKDRDRYVTGEAHILASPTPPVLVPSVAIKATGLSVDQTLHFFRNAAESRV